MSPTARAGQSEPRPHSPSELQRLEAEAHYHRDRLALYRARVQTARPTSAARLRDLERTSEAAAERLRHAKGS